MIFKPMITLILILYLFLSVTSVYGYQNNPNPVIFGLNTPKSLPNPQIKVVAIPEDTDSNDDQITTTNGLIIMVVVLAALILGLFYFLVWKTRNHNGKKKSDFDEDSKR